MVHDQCTLFILGRGSIDPADPRLVVDTNIGVAKVAEDELGCSGPHSCIAGYYNGFMFSDPSSGNLHGIYTSRTQHQPGAASQASTDWPKVLPLATLPYLNTRGNKCLQVVDLLAYPVVVAV